jgi:uncharacterized protein YdaU (DUF1376 family)
MEREKMVRGLQLQEWNSEPQIPPDQFVMIARINLERRKKIDPALKAMLERSKTRIEYARFSRESRARKVDVELAEMKICLQVESAKVNQLRYAFEQNQTQKQAQALTTSPIATKDEAIAFFKEMTASHVATSAEAIGLQQEYCIECNPELVSPKNTLNYASTTARPFSNSALAPNEINTRKSTDETMLWRSRNAKCA